MKRIFYMALLLHLSSVAFAQEAREASPGGVPLSEWVKRLNHKEGAERMAASSALVKLGKECAPAIEALILTTLDRDPDERFKHYESLRSLGEFATPALTKMLGHENRGAAKLAAGLLCGIEPSGVNALKKAFDSKDPLTQDGAFSGISGVVISKGLDGKPLLKELTWDPKDPKKVALKLSLHCTLASRGDGESWEHVKSALKSHNKEKLELIAKARIMSSESSLAVVRSCFKENNRDTIAFLTDTSQGLLVGHPKLPEDLRHESFLIRFWTACALTPGNRIQQHNALGIKIALEAFGHKSAYVRQRAVQLSFHLRTEMIDAALKAFKSKDKLVKQSAARVLLGVNHASEKKNAAKYLIASLSSMKKDERAVVAAELWRARQQTKKVASALIQGLKSGHVDDRLNVMGAALFANVPSKSVFSFIPKALKDKDPKIRLEALKAMLYHDRLKKKWVSAMERALKDSSLELVRYAIVSIDRQDVLIKKFALRLPKLYERAELRRAVEEVFPRVGSYGARLAPLILSSIRDDYRSAADLSSTLSSLRLYYHQRKPSKELKQLNDTLIQILGHSSFMVRADALRVIIELGPLAKPTLKTMKELNRAEFKRGTIATLDKAIAAVGA